MSDQRGLTLGDATRSGRKSTDDRLLL